MSNREYFLKTTKINEYSGGAVVGKTEISDETIVVTKYGSFSAHINERGDLVADFYDQGIICVYNKQGRLDSVTIDVEVYLKGLTKEEKKDMPNGGEDIDEVSDWLESSYKKTMFTVRAEDEVIEVVTFGLKEEDYNREQAPFMDLYSGVNGSIDINGISIPFTVKRNLDEFTIGLGETDGKFRVINTTIISNNVNCTNDVLAGGQRDLQRVAGKVILN